MSLTEREEFKCDSRMIDWDNCLKGFNYGIRRFFFKEDCFSPNVGY